MQGCFKDSGYLWILTSVLCKFWLWAKRTVSFKTIICLHDTHVRLARISSDRFIFEGSSGSLLFLNKHCVCEGLEQFCHKLPVFTIFRISGSGCQYWFLSPLHHSATPTLHSENDLQHNCVFLVGQIVYCNSHQIRAVNKSLSPDPHGNSNGNIFQEHLLIP